MCELVSICTQINDDENDEDKKIKKALVVMVMAKGQAFSFDDYCDSIITLAKQEGMAVDLLTLQPDEKMVRWWVNAVREGKYLQVWFLGTKMHTSFASFCEAAKISGAKVRNRMYGKVIKTVVNKIIERNGPVIESRN